jgi:sortase A
MTHRVAIVASLLLLLPGLLLIGRQGYFRAKGALASQLIEEALAAHLLDGRIHRPWRWADLHPVARLEVAHLGVSQPVLSGASGSSMAFGIGHVDGTAAPGSRGNCVLSGHRDTWLGFLRQLEIGDRVSLQIRSGRRDYRVGRIAVVHESELGVLAPTAGDQLTLLTCYPFDGLARSAWRYVVVCQAENAVFRLSS